MRRIIYTCAILAAFLSLSASAQTPSPKLQFEVATIKPSDMEAARSHPQEELQPRPGIRGGPGSDQPELLTMGYTPMQSLLLRAFNIKAIQLSAPSWLTESRYTFDITAKVPAGATAENSNIMLQNLLVDRFGLVFHRESKEAEGYELVVGKGGSKLKESAAPPPAPAADGAGQPLKVVNDRNGIPQLPPGRPGLLNVVGASGKQSLSAREQSMTQLANAIERLVGKPVVDGTGLTRKYDFSVSFDPTGLPGGYHPPTRIPSAQPNAPADPAPSLFTAVQQDLGLRLDQKKVQLDLIVIDKLDKSPTEN